MRQKFRLCEIRAEDYAFVLLSRILNNLEEQVTHSLVQREELCVTNVTKPSATLGLLQPGVEGGGGLNEAWLCVTWS